MERRQERRRQMDQAAVPAQQPPAHAKNNDPKTWGSYSRRWRHSSRPVRRHRVQPVGTDIAAFDLDKCRDPATGDDRPGSDGDRRPRDSYTEMTPSGTGLRVIGVSSGGAKVHRKQKMPGSDCGGRELSRRRTLHHHHRPIRCRTRSHTWPISATWSTRSWRNWMASNRTATARPAVPKTFAPTSTDG